MGTSFRKTAISNGIILMYSLSWMGTSKSRPPWSSPSSLGVSWSQMAAAVSGRVSQRPIYAIWYIRHLLSLLFHFIGNGSAQHPALANGIGSLIDQKFRIVFQRGIVNGIWI